jgi:hypothetical protein
MSSCTTTVPNSVRISAPVGHTFSSSADSCLDSATVIMSTMAARRDCCTAACIGVSAAAARCLIQSCTSGLVLGFTTCRSL